MRTSRLDAAGRTYFVLEDLDLAETAAARDLAFEDLGGRFAKAFPSDARNLDGAYVGFRREATAMLRQTARLEWIPWEEALTTFLRMVRHHGVRWWLAGSAALAVRGLAVAPRDIDVITDGPGALAMGELLAPYLVEPVVRNDSWVAEWWGRAFVGARLEWVGDVRPGVDQPEPVDFGPAAADRLEVITWHGHQIRVPPLGLQLAVARRRALSERVQLIESALAGCDDVIAFPTATRSGTGRDTDCEHSRGG